MSLLFDNIRRRPRHILILVPQLRYFPKSCLKSLPQILELQVFTEYLKRLVRKLLHQAVFFIVHVSLGRWSSKQINCFIFFSIDRLGCCFLLSSNHDRYHHLSLVCKIFHYTSCSDPESLVDVSLVGNYCSWQPTRTPLAARLLNQCLCGDSGSYLECSLEV